VAGRCNASEDAQDAWDAGDASLASGRNADGSDAGSVFADVILITNLSHHSGPIISQNDCHPEVSIMTVNCILPSRPVRDSWKSPVGPYRDPGELRTQVENSVGQKVCR